MSLQISFSRLGSKFDKVFLSDRFVSNTLDHWKARLLAIIHLFILTLGSLLEIAANVIVPGENLPPLKFGLLLVVVLMIIFKRWGNLVLSGNLLAGVVFSVLLFAVTDSGGLFSDNLLWMLICPLLVLLFADRISGFLWLSVLIVFTTYLYLSNDYSLDFFIAKVAESGPQYYFISYIGLFITVVFIVFVFATGQTMIITALDEKQNELSRQAESLKQAHIQLKAINEELEQFAYAASHDLKEPLRMIKMYTQFIDKRLDKQLDNSSKEYMGFVVDGVTRMERLLTDLLEYSRLGRNNRKSKDTDLNDVLLAVINNLTATMKETNTAIKCNELPVIKSTSTEMIQLFQNLISNSIKFRQDDVTPLIQIKHEVQEGAHHFYFMDNGIGIPPEACDRVFNIFERLHSKTDYEGTGIGLATCKKIVDNLGGKIWVEPGEEEGTTFQFVIPDDAH
ncbi:MAG: ATP-binding protein [Bacteroidota bacterium]